MNINTYDAFNEDDFLFYRGRHNTPLNDKFLEKINEYAGTRVRWRFLNFGNWADGCPNDRIINHRTKAEDLEGKTIVLFVTLDTQVTMMDCLHLCMAFKTTYKVKKILLVISFLLVRRNDHDERNEEIPYLKQYCEFLSYAGVSDIIYCEPHSGAMAKYCQALGIRFVPAYVDFSEKIKGILPRGEKAKKVFYSPDQGSLPRAIAHAKKSSTMVVFDLKKRQNNETRIREASADEINAVISEYSQKFNFTDIKHSSSVDLTGYDVIMIDDERTTGGTANNTARKLRDKWNANIYFLYTHGVSVSAWDMTLFKDNPFKNVVACDTIERDAVDRTGGRIVDTSAADALAIETLGVIRQS